MSPARTAGYSYRASTPSPSWTTRQQTGGGDHICVGSGFGKMAVVLSLATLCRRRLDVIAPDFPKMNTTALSRLENGLPFKLSVHKHCTELPPTS